MNPRLGWFLAVVAAAVAAIVLVPLFRPDAGRPAGPTGLAGQTAPVVALHDDRGATVSLDALRGKIVVLNMWASWCPPCRAEMPDLQRLENEYGRRGLVVIGVNQGESPEHAAAFAHALQITFPIWIDERQQYPTLFASLGLPTTVLIARDGRIERGFDGALTLEQMRAAVAPLLAKT